MNKSDFSLPFIFTSILNVGRVRLHNSNGFQLGPEVKAYFKNGLPKILARNRKKTKENQKPWAISVSIVCSSSRLLDLQSFKTIFLKKNVIFLKKGGIMGTYEMWDIIPKFKIQTYLIPYFSHKWHHFLHKIIESLFHIQYN